jgi:hypothetical protein
MIQIRQPLSESKDKEGNIDWYICWLYDDSTDLIVTSFQGVTKEEAFDKAMIERNRLNSVRRDPARTG